MNHTPTAWYSLLHRYGDRIRNFKIYVVNESNAEREKKFIIKLTYLQKINTLTHSLVHRNKQTNIHVECWYIVHSITWSDFVLKIIIRCEYRFTIFTLKLINFFFLSLCVDFLFNRFGLVHSIRRWCFWFGYRAWCLTLND